MEAIKQYINANDTMLFNLIMGEDNNYATFKIPKKTKGEYRKIEAPGVKLKKIQNRLKELLTLEYQKLTDFKNIGSTGTRLKTNIVSNAQFHINKKHILNIDVSNFYSSINLNRVNRYFSLNEFDFSEKERLILLNLLTYNKHLPQGAPSSPILANLLCIDMDIELHVFAKRNNLIYTRYVDDITFSSNQFIELATLKEAEKIINHYELKLNKKKTRFTSSNHQQVVTGLVVNQHVNINRKKYKIIRAIVNDICRYGLKMAYLKHNNSVFFKRQEELNQFLSEIQGYVVFIGQVLGKENSRYLSLSPVLSYNTKEESRNPNMKKP